MQLSNRLAASSDQHQPGSRIQERRRQENGVREEWPATGPTAGLEIMPATPPLVLAWALALVDLLPPAVFTANVVLTADGWIFFLAFREKYGKVRTSSATKYAPGCPLDTTDGLSVSATSDCFADVAVADKTGLRGFRLGPVRMTRRYHVTLGQNGSFFGRSRRDCASSLCCRRAEGREITGQALLHQSGL